MAIDKSILDNAATTLKADVINYIIALANDIITFTGDTSPNDTPKEQFKKAVKLAITKSTYTQTLPSTGNTITLGNNGIPNGDRIHIIDIASSLTGTGLNIVKDGTTYILKDFTNTNVPLNDVTGKTVMVYFTDTNVYRVTPSVEPSDVEITLTGGNIASKVFGDDLIKRPSSNASFDTLSSKFSFNMQNSISTTDDTEIYFKVFLTVNNTIAKLSVVIRHTYATNTSVVNIMGTYGTLLTVSYGVTHPFANVITFTLDLHGSNSIRTTFYDFYTTPNANVSLLSTVSHAPTINDVTKKKNLVNFANLPVGITTIDELFNMANVVEEPAPQHTDKYVTKDTVGNSNTFSFGRDTVNAKISIDVNGVFRYHASQAVIERAPVVPATNISVLESSIRNGVSTARNTLLKIYNEYLTLVGGGGVVNGDIIPVGGTTSLQVKAPTVADINTLNINSVLTKGTLDNTFRTIADNPPTTQTNIDDDTDVFFNGGYELWTNYPSTVRPTNTKIINYNIPRLKLGTGVLYGYTDVESRVRTTSGFVADYTNKTLYSVVGDSSNDDIYRPVPFHGVGYSTYSPLEAHNYGIGDLIFKDNKKHSLLIEYIKDGNIGSHNKDSTVMCRTVRRVIGNNILNLGLTSDGVWILTDDDKLYVKKRLYNNIPYTGSLGHISSTEGYDVNFVEIATGVEEVWSGCDKLYYKLLSTGAIMGLGGNSNNSLGDGTSVDKSTAVLIDTHIGDSRVIVYSSTLTIVTHRTTTNTIIKVSGSDATFSATSFATLTEVMNKGLGDITVIDGAILFQPDSTSNTEAYGFVNGTFINDAVAPSVVSSGSGDCFFSHNSDMVFIREAGIMPHLSHNIMHGCNRQAYDSPLGDMNERVYNNNLSNIIKFRNSHHRNAEYILCEGYPHTYYIFGFNTVKYGKSAFNNYRTLIPPSGARIKLLSTYRDVSQSSVILLDQDDNIFIYGDKINMHAGNSIDDTWLKIDKNKLTIATTI